jgi:hypothetical protein
MGHLTRHNLVEDHRPATFLERGVVVPFTTPFLLGARVRPCTRAGLELVVPSPAGIRGYYVLPFGALRDVCTPTLHDRLLAEAIGATSLVTPHAILRLSRRVAREGLAGHSAAEAAEAAEREDANQRLVTNFRLLLALVEQSERPGEAPSPAGRDTPAGMERRAHRAIGRASAELGLSAETIVAALESLAGLLADVGFPGNPTAARHPRQLAELEQLGTEVEAWAATAVEAEEASAATLITGSVALTIGCARPILAQLGELTGDMPALLRRWSREQPALMELGARPGWLMDGWATLAGIWRNAERGRRAAAIREMSMLVPLMPREADHWIQSCNMDSVELQPEAVHRARRRFVFRLEEWRTGRVLELIARNEKLVREAV